MSKVIAAILAFATTLPVLAHEAPARGDKADAARMEQKAWGIAGKAARVTRTIEIAMSDAMRFSPAAIEVRQGEVVRLVVRNEGALLHELVIGTKPALAEHAALMAKHPGMEHDEPYMAHVSPGKKGELVWEFNRPGEFHFACLVAGHYQAGMVGTIKVVAR